MQNACLGESFMDGLPIFASILGQKLGVKVALGNACCTNGETVYLPARIDERRVTREEMLGFVVHEAAHIRFTDMTVGMNLRPILFRLLNGLEDARIEKRMMQAYAGAKFLLNRATRPLIQRIEQQLDKANAPTVFTIWAQSAVGSTYNAIFESLASQSRARCDALFGQQLMTEASAVLKTFAQWQCTQDALTAAEALIDLLDKKSWEPFQKPEAGQDGQQKDGLDVGDREKEPERGNTQPTESENRKSDSRTVPDAAKAEPKILESVFRTICAATTDIGMTVDLSRELADKISAAVSPIEDLKPIDVLVDCNPPSLSVLPQRLALGTERIRRAQLESSRLRRCLQGIVQSRTNIGQYASDHGRRLCSSRLAQLAMGSPKVFARREQRQGTDTAVSILLDLSGSLGILGCEKAVQASLALLAGLRAIPRVKSTLNVFPSTGIPEGLCNSGLWVKIVPFDVPIAKQANLIGALDSYGSTPVMQALLGTIAELSQRTERKKVVLLITDGQLPQCSREFLEMTRNRDCIVAGIFIDVDEQSIQTYAGYFDLVEGLTDCSSLGPVLMKISERILLSNLSSARD